MVDGDKSLVVADELFVNIAERNMKGIVPLYYNMRKAQPTEINNETIYQGLNAAFTHGNIGIYSNNITKIFNSDIFINGTIQEQEHALKCVKLLCMENNFCIDSAKTLYMPLRPKWFKYELQQYTNCKLPYFFQYAKEKEIEQVEDKNGSFVNKLSNIIKNTNINTRGIGLDNVVYTKMMNDPYIVCNDTIKTLYDKLNKEYRYKINYKDKDIDNLNYVANIIKDEFVSTGYSLTDITDMLIEYLYGHDKRSKQLLWFCFGDIIYDNLRSNLIVHKTKYIQCLECGEWIEIDSRDNKTIYCHNCYQNIYKNKKKKRIK